MFNLRTVFPVPVFTKQDQERRKMSAKTAIRTELPGVLAKAARIGDKGSLLLIYNLQRATWLTCSLKIDKSG